MDRNKNKNKNKRMPERVFLATSTLLTETIVTA